MKYEDHVLLEFILKARRPVSAKEILAHLTDSVEGYSARASKDGGLKNVQNRLKHIADCDQFRRFIEVTQDGSSLRYKGIKAGRGADTTMSIEHACTLLMSDKHLSELAPTRLFQTLGEYQELIASAEDVVKKHQHNRLQHNRHVSDFLKRVAVMQRGQPLIGADVDNDVLESIASCVIKKKCISLEYNGKRRVLHPFGLVFRQPKIYLLAVDTETLKKNGASRTRPRQFLCNRIKDARVSREPHQVPDEFNADTYAREGRLDLVAYADKDGEGITRSFTLSLRLDGKRSQNMIRDLEEYPLSKNQHIDKEPGSDDYILKASGMRATHSLVEWVMGRVGLVEVLEPKNFRNHIKAQVERMYQQYHN